MNWLGIRTRREFFDPSLNFVEWGLPTASDPQIFEWIALLDAVMRADKRFAMIELGAGYGRWTVNAARAAELYARLPCVLVAVEAEPTHFRWLAEHCADNQVTAALVHAAVAAEAGAVSFGIGKPREWYGQAIADGTWQPEQTAEVEAVTLTSLLDGLGPVDLIDMDIQGAEADVIGEALPALGSVRKLFLETHSEGVEERLRRLLSDAGFTCSVDYACGEQSDTRFGPMSFAGGGTQVWDNSRVS